MADQSDVQPKGPYQRELLENLGCCSLFQNHQYKCQNANEKKKTKKIETP
jgi:hypothetical protein